MGASIRRKKCAGAPSLKRATVSHNIGKMSWYPLNKEGQLSHKYAIASPVEPMNLLSKGSNELLPKY